MLSRPSLLFLRMHSDGNGAGGSGISTRGKHKREIFSHRGKIPRQNFEDRDGDGDGDNTLHSRRAFLPCMRVSSVPLSPLSRSSLTIVSSFLIVLPWSPLSVSLGLLLFSFYFLYFNFF